MPSSGKEDFFAALQALVPEAFEHNEWVSARLPHMRMLIALDPKAPGAGWHTYDAFCAVAPELTHGDGPDPLNVQRIAPQAPHQQVHAGQLAPWALWPSSRPLVGCSYPVTTGNQF
jgi:hypothetical protein